MKDDQSETVKRISWKQLGHSVCMIKSQIEHIEPDAFDIFPKSSQDSDVVFSVSSNHLRSLNLNFERMQVKELNLSDNRLVGLDTNTFDTLGDLEALELVNTFKLDAEVDLSFIQHLFNLKTLSLTLPANFSLELLRNLEQLEQVTLLTSVTRDANRTRFKMDAEAFAILASLEKLNRLSLQGFDMDLDQTAVLPRWPMSLNTIELVNNMITSLAPFQEMFTFVQDLKISHNKLGQIDDQSFAGRLNRTRTLNLSRCFVKEISKNAFADGFERLLLLDLTNNLIENLSDDAFCSLKSLEELHLSDNRIERITNNSFRGLNKLDTLKLDNNPIETIEPMAFWDLEDLGHLALNNCNLKSIDIFVLLQLPNLQNLDLSGNQIDSLTCTAQSSNPIQLNSRHLKPEEAEMFLKIKLKPPVYSFITYSSPLNINLSNNQLEYIDMICFARFKTLHELNLSNNKLENITNNFGLDLGLTGLNLSNNQLRSFEPGFLRFLSRKNSLDFMHYLNLANNLLEMTVDEETFSKTVVFMNFLGNKSVKISESAIRNWTSKSYPSIRLKVKAEELSLTNLQQSVKLQYLCIRNRSQEEIENCFLAQDKFSHSHVSLYIELAHDSIASLDNIHINSCCPEVSELVLTGNVLTSLKATWFAGLDSLMTLNLSDNRLANLDYPEVFSALRNLKTLNLSGNKLEKMHARLFRKLFNLEHLDLSNNRLEALDSSQFRDLFKLKKIALSQNSFKHLQVAKVFRPTRILTSIDLSCNQLDDSSFTEDSLGDAELPFVLTGLYLAQNCLKGLKFIRNFVELESLDLSHNCIESLHDENKLNLFARLMALKSVDLSHNPLRQPDEAVFGHLSLDYLDLTHHQPE